MKRFTIICTILLVLVFAATMVYVSVIPDFVKPGTMKEKEAVEDPVAPVWDMTMDDMLDYLEAQGFLVKDELIPVAGGVGTQAYGFNGAELYWWDMENLAEDSNEYAAYQGMVSEGVIDVWQLGSIFMPVTQNGPFGLNVSNYSGDASALLNAFAAIGQEPAEQESAEVVAPVWSKTMEDMLDYLEEQGLLVREELIPVAGGVGTQAYGFNGAELYWWDVENLAEDSNEYAAYQGMVSEGVIDVWQLGSIFMPVTQNGPFGLNAANYTGNVSELLDAFEAFGAE